MSSNVIPKEKLSAYQRWELASFNEEPKQELPATSEEVARANAATLAALREQAQRQGYEEGYAQGHAQGLQDGHVQAAQELEHLRQMMQSFSGDVMQANDVVANDLLSLALDFAKAMLKTSLRVKPELVLPIVSEAIRYLPSVQQPALLFLHPEDAVLVQEHMADELAKGGWRVAEDLQMERGGCRIETATNQIDAVPAVRWQRIADALGKHPDWFE
jgi:flagellar assembly protein FliH